MKTYTVWYSTLSGILSISENDIYQQKEFMLGDNKVTYFILEANKNEKI